MEMEVVMPVPASMDFNFDSACSSPYMTAPSSPQRFGNFFFSAPTSPSRVSSSSSFYRDLNNDDDHHRCSSLTFNVAEIKNTKREEDDEDFEFNFSGQLERTSLSADELFDGGKIRPLKPSTTSDSERIRGQRRSAEDQVCRAVQERNRGRQKLQLPVDRQLRIVSLRRRVPPSVSAHELHYTANRAVAEEMKRKTFLPYKQGLLGCLGFNPGGVHDISRGVGSLTRV
ncbi:hypothetical protein JRO89_XS02G0061800 [Xanthoceras sorbifolium]|uniref:Uncharacterized protein n=1 Tax=Xanthoceras sorbifolium TaxID=99658 RepID=A0ABQ8IF69_9ROSI|nr:hypothetical protein JRO89_XS02G0061800 [Xanthoceras sorbifolium]